MQQIQSGDDHTYRVHLITNNLAHTYNQIKEYDTALKLYLDNIKFIKSRNWNDLLEYSYDGIIVSYEKKRDFENAYNYLELYHGLKDSLRGAKIQVEITELRSDFHAQNKELIYAREKQKLEIRNLVLAVVILLVLMVLILVLFLLRKKRKELAIHKAKLSQLTQLLISKNEALRQAYPIDDELQDRRSILFRLARLLWDRPEKEERCEQEDAYGPGCGHRPGLRFEPPLS